MNEHHIITLDNGIRLVHLEVQHSEIFHCGFMINVGSRDEDEHNNGAAHFIEHTVFKGTTNRKSHHILRRIESVGGELNAYTTREKTCYYASCLRQYAERAIDLLTDITFHSTFPPKEIEKEKQVILEEIDMYDDSPEESIYDDLYSRVFKGHPLGYNILGTKDTVKSMMRDDLKGFILDNYVADHMVLSIVGNVSQKQATQLAHRFLSNIEINRTKEDKRKKPPILPAFYEKEEKDFAQTHVIIGSRAYSRNDNKRFGLSLINNVLGAAGMSARLNMAVREKHGLTYNVGSSYSSYQDAGMFTVYFAADAKNVNRAMDLVHKELKKVREVRFTEKQLHEAKVQLLGQMAQVMENNSVHMQQQARTALDYGRVFSFDEFMKEVDKVSATEILEIANECFDPAKLYTLIYEQEKES
jgi:predicted Zn-dependent peptidase